MAGAEAWESARVWRRGASGYEKTRTRGDTDRLGPGRRSRELVVAFAVPLAVEDVGDGTKSRNARCRAYAGHAWASTLLFRILTRTRCAVLFGM